MGRADYRGTPIVNPPNHKDTPEAPLATGAEVAVVDLAVESASLRDDPSVDRWARSLLPTKMAVMSLVI